MRQAGMVAAVAGGLALLAACEDAGPTPPREAGACFHMVQPRDGGAPRFNRVAANVPSLEECAATLEGMRRRFASLGMQREQLTGAYQGRFLFLRPAGVYTATQLNDRGYLALVRTGDGRLAQPGAVRQPGG